VNLDGRVAIVTGGAQSIGAAIVRELAGQGARVAIVDVAQGPGERLAAGLGEAALFVHADIGDPAGPDDAADVVVDRFGGVDLLATAPPSRSASRRRSRCSWRSSSSPSPRRSQACCCGSVVALARSWRPFCSRSSWSPGSASRSRSARSSVWSAPS